MRTATRTHFSIVDGKPRGARVTVGACSHAERKQVPEMPQYLLNDQSPPRLSEEDEEYIRAAQAVAEDCWSKSARRDEVAVVLKLHLPLVDMHIEAVRAATAEATKALLEHEQET